MVPLGSFVTLESRASPSSIVRYNLYPAADVTGGKSPFISTGQALDKLEALAAGHAEPVQLPLDRDAEGVWRTDWAGLLKVLTDAGLPPQKRAAIFHASLAQALADQKALIERHGGVERVLNRGGLAGTPVPGGPSTLVEVASQVR